MCLLHFRTRPAGVSTNEEILLRVLPALAGETVSGASVLLGSDSSTSYGGSVKTRPSSAARPSLPYRTSKLFLPSLFQGAATGMNDSSEKVWGRFPTCLTRLQRAGWKPAPHFFIVSGRRSRHERLLRK